MFWVDYCDDKKNIEKIRVILLVLKEMIIYLHCDYTTTGCFPRNIKKQRAMKTLLNTFSYQLKKHAMQTINSKPIYSNGEYLVYKFCDNHYLYTFKNLIIAERCGLDKTIIDDLSNDIYTGEPSKKYYNFDRPKQTIEIGINAAKELNFIIE